jgi:hypothetical protein
MRCVTNIGLMPKNAHLQLYLKFRLVDVAKRVLHLNAVADAVPLDQEIKVVIARRPGPLVNRPDLVRQNAPSGQKPDSTSISP